MDERISDKPRFVPDNYKEIFSSPCEMFHEFGQDWYKGTGIKPKKHPLLSYIGFRGCGNCESDNVLVIAAQWCVSYHSGDAYWDYEIFCKKCGKFTQRAYAEND